MNNSLLSDSFIELVENICENDKLLSEAHKKIRGKITGYAKFINIPIDKLGILHVSNEQGKLNRKIISYINKLPQKQKNSSKNVKKYNGEIFSTLRRLISRILQEQNESENPEETVSLSVKSVIEQQLPSWMLPLLDVLPRGDNKNPWLRSRNFTIYRQQELTENSIFLLNGLLKIIKINNIHSLHSLLIEYRTEIYEELKITNSKSTFKTLQQIIYKVRNELSLTKPAKNLTRLSFENWSKKFQKQWKTYEDFAEQGLPDTNSIARFAIQFNASVEPVTKTTISGYKHALEWGLYHCQPLPKNWGVENLLNTQLRTIKYGDIEQPEFYNEVVDRYQSREQNRSSKYKRVGYDSCCFGQFKNALKSIAAFNGLAYLIEPFSRAYPVKLDKVSKDHRKTQKKKQYSIREIDENINRLEAEFNQIVKNRTFARRPGVSSLDADKDMRLCIFYSMLITFRFLGLRQRNVRNCRIMRNPEIPDNLKGNIGFRKDGTVVFHYEANETKNNKRLHFEFNLNKHGKTHGLLIRGLTTYFKKVYPYIQQNSLVSLEEQFFVYAPQKRGKFARFPDDRARIYSFFTNCRDVFLKFQENSDEQISSVHPHFLRGICADWLKNDLHFTIEQAAEYIGDEPTTLRKHYLDKNRIYDATPHITEINRVLSERAEEKENYAEKLTTLTTQFERIQDRFDNNDEERIALKAQLAQKDVYIEILTNELAQLRQGHLP